MAVPHLGEKKDFHVGTTGSERTEKCGSIAGRLLISLKKEIFDEDCDKMVEITDGKECY